MRAFPRCLLPVPWWLHVDLDVLGSTELPAMDYPQPGGLTWQQLTQITVAALATDGRAGWSVCIYTPTLTPTERARTALSDT
jgi:arginase